MPAPRPVGEREWVVIRAGRGAVWRGPSDRSSDPGPRTIRPGGPKGRSLAQQRTLSSFYHIFREGWELPILLLFSTLQPDWSSRNNISSLSWLNLTIPLSALRIKPRLHSLAHKALHDPAPLLVSSFNCWSLTLYTPATRKFLPFPQRTMFSFASRNFHILAPPPNYSLLLPFYFHPLGLNHHLLWEVLLDSPKLG